MNVPSSLRMKQATDMVLGMYDRLNRAETGGFLVKRKNRATGRRKKKEPEAAPSAEGAGEDGTEGAALHADGELNPEAAAEEVAGESNSRLLMSWASVMCMPPILSPEISISLKYRLKFVETSTEASPPLMCPVQMQRPPSHTLLQRDLARMPVTRWLPWAETGTPSQTSRAATPRRTKTAMMGR